MQGSREWRDISVTADVCGHLARATGVAVRVQGLGRYYAFVLHNSGEARIIKVAGDETILATVPFDWHLGQPYQLTMTASGDQLVASIDGSQVLTATDQQLRCGGMGLLIEEGRTATHRIAVEPA